MVWECGEPLSEEERSAVEEDLVAAFAALGESAIIE
jgi:hypothetical protein